MDFLIRDPDKADKTAPASPGKLKACPCGRRFTPYRSYQLYCSDKCQEKYGSGKSGRYAQKPFVVVECQNPECTEKFRTNDGKRRYCRHSCYLRAQELRRVEAHKQECKTCGKVFITTHAAKEYCSTDCRKIARRKRDEARKPKL